MLTYESFVEGGKEGIEIAFSIIPYLVGMLVAITVFRASGALDFVMGLCKPFFTALGIPAEVVPLALIRPISGTAALGMTTDLIAVYGLIHLSAGWPRSCRDRLTRRCMS